MQSTAFAPTARVALEVELLHARHDHRHAINTSNAFGLRATRFDDRGMAAHAADARDTAAYWRRAADQHDERIGTLLRQLDA